MRSMSLADPRGGPLAVQRYAVAKAAQRIAMSQRTT
jgi:hypothetical protein